jgi:hypothetical protein
VPLLGGLSESKRRCRSRSSVGRRLCCGRGETTTRWTDVTVLGRTDGSCVGQPGSSSP